ncbi:stage II sporulation protein M [Halanaerobaculum tunisiense]
MINYRYSKRQFNYYLRNHPILLFIVLGCFLLGVLAGSIAVNTLSYQQKKELVNYLEQFVVQINHLLNNQQEFIVQKIIMSNLKFIILLWLLGLTIVGAVIAPLLIVIKGFIIGFTISFLLRELFLRGFLLAVVAIIPQNLIVIGCLMLGCVFSLIYASMVGKGWFFNYSKLKYNFGHLVLRYTILMLGLGILLLGASVIEIYLTPNLVNLVADYLVN